jgi:hypothetical protein
MPQENQEGILVVEEEIQEVLEEILGTVTEIEEDFN